jgi:hypothetical protein
MVRGRTANVGATRVSPNGYHYTKTKSRGWIATHRLVVERHIDRRIRPGERIRFLDGDKENRSIDNLELYQTKKPTTASRQARLEAKIEELQAELEELEDEEAI